MNDTRRSAAADAQSAAVAERTERSDFRTEPEDDPPERELSKDELFGVLKNRRRRQTLEYLKRNDGAADRGDIAEYIAARENDIEIVEISCSQRKRVYISLHQCHLPKMADIGAITYDQTRGTVELEPAADLLFPYLELDPRSAAEARRTDPRSDDASADAEQSADERAEPRSNGVSASVRRFAGSITKHL